MINHNPLQGEKEKIMADKQGIPIGSLSPSAARLLIAFVTKQEHEEVDQIIMRSGIRYWQTYLKAKQQLLEGGYLFTQKGILYATLKPVK
jgi:hypothetical protein